MDELALTEPFDDAAKYWALRDWGVPEELIPFATWRATTVDDVKLPPQLELSSGWDPEQEPRLASIRPLLHAGAGLSVRTAAPFRLSWFADVLPRISSLWLYSDDPSNFVDPELIEEMSAVRSLILPKTDRTLRLAQLPALEDVSIQSPSQFDAIGAPRLRRLDLDAGVLPTRFTVPEGVEFLIISARRVDLTAIGDLTGLRKLILDGVSTVDLQPLAGSQHLEFLRVWRARSVIGLAALTTCTNLESIDFHNITEVDDLDALRRVRTTRLSAVGAAFDETFAAAVKGTPGWWVQPRRGRGRARRREIFEISEAGEEVEVTLRDFGWIQAQLGAEDIELTSEDIESLIAFELRGLGERWLGDSGLAEFDSEAEAVIIKLPNSKTAKELISILDPFFSSRRRVRAVAKKLSLCETPAG